MQSRRWVLALVITLMLIDPCLKRAEANAMEPVRTPICRMAHGPALSAGGPIPGNPAMSRVE